MRRLGTLLVCLVSACVAEGQSFRVELLPFDSVTRTPVGCPVPLSLSVCGQPVDMECREADGIFRGRVSVDATSVGLLAAEGWWIVPEDRPVVLPVRDDLPEEAVVVQSVGMTRY